MREEFMNFLNELMKANPELTAKLKTENVDNYISALNQTGISAKTEMTENGKKIIEFMKGVTIPMKSADIASGLGLSSKSVSGSMRKLVSEKYVEKIGDRNFVYIITDKGKKYNEN